MAERINLCDIAKEHLLPWLAGRLDGTPEGQAFEAHVRDCKACSALVTDRRRAMQALLALAEESSPFAGEATPQQAGAKQMQLPSWRALVQSKGTAILTVAAALLLVVSYSIKPGEGLLGEKALSPASEEANHQSVETKAETVETTHAVESKPSSETPDEPDSDIATPATNRPQPNHQPQVGEKQQAPPRAARKPTPKGKPAARSKPAGRSSRSGQQTTGAVEVYDESGRLIGSAATGGQK
jgi:outer membrane biosynthesis protein TonB